MIRKQALHPGDILFFRTKKGSLPGSWLISWFQNIVGKSPIHDVSYSHVGIVDWNTAYILDSRWPKSKRRKINWKSWNKHYGVELWRVRKVKKEEIQKALDWCYNHLNEWYDLGLFVWGMFDVKHAEVCSTFVAKAWKKGGRIFKVYKRIGKARNFHSPDELIANSNIIKRIS